MTSSKVRSLEDDLKLFQTLDCEEQKQLIKTLRMIEAEDLISPPVSQHFLDLLLDEETPKH